MSIKNYYRKKIADRIISNHEKIKIVSGECRYNFRCQMNAVHEAKRQKDPTLAMCVYMDGNYPIIHFINIHDGKYIDNTLGEWSATYDYYLIKIIKEDEFWGINDIFMSYRRELNRYTPWFIKLES